MFDVNEHKNPSEKGVKRNADGDFICPLCGGECLEWEEEIIQFSEHLYHESTSEYHCCDCEQKITIRAIYKLENGFY